MAPIEIDPNTGAPIIKSDNEVATVKDESPSTIVQPATSAFVADKIENNKTTSEVNKEETKVSESTHEVDTKMTSSMKAVKDAISGKTIEVHVGLGIKVTNTKLQQIEAILRGSGLDSMSQIKVNEQIKEVLGN